MNIDIERVRDRAYHYTSPTVADDVGISFEDGRMFVNGTRTPPPDRIERLARRIGLSQ